MRDADEAVSRHKESSKGVNVVEKLQPLVAAIEQYGQALNVYANAYPLVLSPLWGSVRVVLQVSCGNMSTSLNDVNVSIGAHCLSQLARDFGKYFDKLLDMFTQIGDVLPRFQIFERLFGRHELVVEALSDVYVDIINFCAVSNCLSVSLRFWIVLRQLALSVM